MQLYASTCAVTFDNLHPVEQLPTDMNGDTMHSIASDMGGPISKGGTDGGAGGAAIALPLGTRTLCFSNFLLCYAPILNTKQVYA